MKNRFSTIDIVAIVCELQKYVGMRVNQVYDVDNKTYLFKLNRQEEKVTLLVESGIRIHTTEFQWPKNPAPSGFSMKLRKHLKNKRLERLVQLGIDRVIDMQFGSDEAAYHVILELYDKGNIVLTDCVYEILNILRPRTVGSEDVKLVVRERYPIENARQSNVVINREEIYNALNAAKAGAALKKVLMPCLPFGPAVLEHVLLQSKFPKNSGIGKDFNISSDINHLFLCLEEGEKFLKEASSLPCKGYIIQKAEKNSDALGNSIVTNVEFHPFLFSQHESLPHVEYPSFDKAVDNYFSNLEGQKIDLKAFNKEKEAMKKLENFKKDHEQRLQQLQKNQELDVRKAQLIEMNLELVDRAILIMRSAIASQFSWSDIRELLREAQQTKDPVACSIRELKLEINHITILLNDPYYEDGNSSSTDAPHGVTSSMAVDIDLALSGYANARKYYDMKRHHAKKEQKTIESSEKAYKSAERKTKLALKEVAVTTSITKARKTFWFEKFLWFISSENYLVIAGRDIQQNELIVKRYMKSGDVYVHADMHGASSVVIKNFQGGEIPPKTLNEAGTMAICYSTAWDAKIVTSAWWVYHHQVSKTAPSGEYLTPGSFMIRGKKNYLPPSYLVLGFGFLFKLDEDSLERHREERNSKTDENQSDNPGEDNDQEEINELMSDDDDTSTENNDEERRAEGGEEGNSSGEDSTGAERRSSSNSVVEFPDTEVRFDMLKIEPKVTEKEAVPEATMIVQVPRKVKKGRKPKNEEVQVETNEIESARKEEKPGVTKRGHRGKLKKIKEKYKYQDEEERELRMKILASAGEKKEDKKKKKNKDSKACHKPNNKQKFVHFAQPPEPGVAVPATSDVLVEAACVESKADIPAVSEDEPAPFVQEHIASDEEIEDEAHTSEDLKILCSLTGSPTSEDTLLFAIPVCAPYMAMQSYKYKVKVMPGTGRRGKASKTALQMFLHDKSGMSREKDLLRSVKDQDISRNFPGKVKLSAPNFKKLK